MGTPLQSSPNHAQADAEPRRLVDPRGPRFNQAVLAVGLLVGAVADARWVVPAFALVLFLGAAFGPRYGPFLRLYAEVIKPLLAPPAELEDPRPPRFAAAVGVAFLAAAALAFAAGAVGVGWVLALMVAALAGLAAVTGICVGCEVYLFLRLALARRQGHRGGPSALGLADLTAGRTGETWVVFTTPYCATCGPVIDKLAAAVPPGAEVLAVDATEHPHLADALRIKAAPTAVLAGTDGRVRQRLVGPAAVDAYLATACVAYQA